VSPFARPVASSHGPESSCVRATSAQVPAGKDVPSGHIPTSRVSARQLARIRQDLSDRDRAVLLVVQQLRLISGGQLQRLYWPGDEAARRGARRGLLRLVQWRVVDRLPRKLGGMRAGSDAFIYRLGPVGHRLLVLDGFVGQRIGEAPSERRLAHLLAISECVVRLKEAERSGAVEVIELQAEPACWRPFLSSVGASLIAKPDLFLRLGAGTALEDQWYVEVDQATEHAGALKRKLDRYDQHFASHHEQDRHGVYPRIIWAVPDTKRAAQLHRLIEQHGTLAQRLHVVTTHQALVPLLVSEARA
jgi:hypothetical protein